MTIFTFGAVSVSKYLVVKLIVVGGIVCVKGAVVASIDVNSVVGSDVKVKKNNCFLLEFF